MDNVGYVANQNALRINLSTHTFVLGTFVVDPNSKSIITLSRQFVK